MESNLICNIIDWDTTDTDNKFIIHAYGVDENGNSVGLRIINFLPEYFIRIHNKDDDNQNDIMEYFDDNLDIIKLSKEYSWLDTGTFDTLLEASNFVKLNKK